MAFYQSRSNRHRPFNRNGPRFQMPGERPRYEDSRAIPYLHRKARPQAAPQLPKAELRRQAEEAYQRFMTAPARPAARPRPKRCFDDLNPCSPYDQLPGVDMDQLPWY